MLSGEEKLAFVRRQFDEMWATGEPRTIECPYCLRFVQPGEVVCCETLARAAAALIERAIQSRMYRRSLMN